MKSIRHKSTLVYYDGFQVFEAVDPIGGNYIAVLVDAAEPRERYLVAGVEPERLRRFRIGGLDLRSLLLERAIEDWYLASPGESPGELSLERQTGLLSETPYVPEPGFLLHEQPPTSETLSEARSRNNLVIVGLLKKVDMIAGSWKLETEDGMVSGGRKNGGPSLAGLETDARYRFKCVEEVVGSESGKEERSLYVIEHEPV